MDIAAKERRERGDACIITHRGPNRHERGRVRAARDTSLNDEGTAVSVRNKDELCVTVVDDWGTIESTAARSGWIICPIVQEPV
jgi:hypothetical protein